MEELKKNATILDVACGGKMFYFDKQDERVLFCDIRSFETTLFDKMDIAMKEINAKIDKVLKK